MPHLRDKLTCFLPILNFFQLVKYATYISVEELGVFLYVPHLRIEATRYLSIVPVQELQVFALGFTFVEVQIWKELVLAQTIWVNKDSMWYHICYSGFTEFFLS